MWHLSELNSSSHLFDQASSEVMSDWRMRASFFEFIFRNNFVSSANMNVLESSSSGRSLIYNMKSYGPRTAAGSDSSPFTFTTWVRPMRNDLIHFRIFPLTPYASSLPISLRCGTVSNSFAKSK